MIALDWTFFNLPLIPSVFAACLTDCISWDEYNISLALDQYGYLLLYTTPESLWKLELSDIPVSLLVVDECHCVTSWGYGFRKAYLEIGDFVDSLSHRPQMVALTATAPMADREQIKQLLHMKHVREHTVSLYRPKLTFSSYSFVSEEARQKKLKHLLKRHMKSGDGSCIIYCNTKKHADTVYDLIKTWYPDQVAICRSNLPNKERKRNEKAFMRGERRIMVATLAFGMGINKSDVRLIIHYNLPLSLIDYYQQAGRAGRDGGKARCILLYNKSDYDLNRYVIEQNQEFRALDYLRILKKSHLIPGYRVDTFKACEKKAKDPNQANQHSHCIRCKQVSILCYDKIDQLKMIKRCPHELEDAAILRLEVQLKRPALKRVLGKKALENNTALLKAASDQVAEVIHSYLSRMFPCTACSWTSSTPALRRCRRPSTP